MLLGHCSLAFLKGWGIDLADIHGYQVYNLPKQNGDSGPHRRKVENVFVLSL